MNQGMNIDGHIAMRVNFFKIVNKKNSEEDWWHVSKDKNAEIVDLANNWSWQEQSSKGEIIYIRKLSSIQYFL